MDPLLITVDLLFAVIGLFVVWIAWRLHSKGEIPHKTAVPVFLLGGVLLMVGVTMTPSRILTSITSNEVENQTSQQMVAQDDDGPDDLTVVDGGPKGKTIIITDDEDLKNLLRQAIAKLPEATKEISTNSDISTELLNVNGTDDDDSSGDDDSTTEDDDSGDDDSAQVDERRDPFKVAVLVQESEPVVMTPVMTHPRARIRTLPKEPVSGATPLCTDFKLLHGQAGGPEPGGCHVVGCSQGYALPMQHLPSGGWGQCDSVNRVERIDQCYVVPDADGTERGRTFSEDGSWVDCPVS
jgi:hypothetical protein